MNTLFLEPRHQAFAESLQRAGGQTLRSLGWEAARLRFEALQRGQGNGHAMQVQDLRLALGPTGSVDVRIIRPDDQRATLPALLYCPGGIGLTGNRRTHDRLLRLLARRVGAAVVLVEYEKLPGHCHPVQLEQAYAVLEHLARNGAALSIDGQRIAVAGDGLGATIATAMTLLAKCRRGPCVLQQVLFCPVTAGVGRSGSYRSHRQGPWLTRDDMALVLATHLPDETARSDPFALPLLADHDLLNDLPDALVVVAECDPLRDQGEAYARRLMESEVGVACTRFAATMHDFVVLDALAASAPARAAVSQAVDVLREAFAD
jgi:acetyl esterase